MEPLPAQVTLHGLLGRLRPQEVAGVAGQRGRCSGAGALVGPQLPQTQLRLHLKHFHGYPCSDMFQFTWTPMTLLQPIQTVSGCLFNEQILHVGQ